MEQKTSVGQIFAYLATVVGGILMIANVWWSQESPMGKVGAIILILILAVVWGFIIRWFGSIGCVGWGTVIVVSCLILLAGGDAWTRTTGRPALQAEVNIDNSVDIYPMPSADSPDYPKWFEAKVEVLPGEGAQKTFVTGLYDAIGAFLLVSLIGKLFTMIPIKKLQGIQIPIQLIFLMVWTVISLYLISSPINTREMDEATSAALSNQWLIGFSKNLIWGPIVSLLSGAVSLLRRGARMLGIYAISFAVAALTWLFVPLFATVIDPTMVAWTICANQLLNTGITNSLCQEAYSSGAVAAFACSMVWGWIHGFLEL